MVGGSFGPCRTAAGSAEPCRSTHPPTVTSERAQPRPGAQRTFREISLPQRTPAAIQLGITLHLEPRSPVVLLPVARQWCVMLLSVDAMMLPPPQLYCASMSDAAATAKSQRAAVAATE